MQLSGLRLALSAHKHGRVTIANESQCTGKLTHAARRKEETTANYNLTGTPRSAM